jgi:hypothetical protein
MKQTNTVLVLLALFAGLQGQASAAISTATPTSTVTPTFTVTPTDPAPLILGTACSFGLLAYAGITNANASTLAGDIGSQTSTFTDAGSLNQTSGTNHGNDSVTQGAMNDLRAAFTDGQSRPSIPIATELGTQVLQSGVYSAGTFTLNGVLTLDGNNDPNAVFIFQAASTLIASGSSIGSVNLINGANAMNVFWVVGSATTLNTGTVFVGSVLSSAGITLDTNASDTQGRLLDVGAAISIDTSNIAITACSVATASPSPSPSLTPSASSSATSTETVNTSLTPSPSSTETAGGATASPSATSSETVNTSLTPSPTASFTETVNTSGTPSPSSTSTPTPGVAPGNGSKVDLGSADQYSVLGGSDITNTGNSAVTGYVGVSPGTSQTGFGSFAQGCTNMGTSTSTAQAKNDLTTAFNDAQGRVITSVVPVQLGGNTYPAGVYGSTSGLGGTFQITGTLVLDGGGDTNSVFIFKMATTLNTASGAMVKLINGATAQNVFWEVGTSATLGDTNTFQGTIMAGQSISVLSGSTINGRLLAETAGVTVNTIQINTVSIVPCDPNGATPTNTPVVTATSTVTISATFSASPSSTSTQTVVNGSATSTETAVSGSATSTQTAVSGSATSTQTVVSGSPTRTATLTASPSPVTAASFSPTPSPVTHSASGTPTAVVPATGDTYFYPSPARGQSGAVAYNMKSSGTVTLKIYNQTGRLVDTVNDTKPAGPQSSSVSVGSFASGTYYYVLYIQYNSGSSETITPRKFAVLRP